MDKANSKILTLSFALAGALTGFTVHLLLKIFSGTFGIVARATNSEIIRHGIPLLVGFGLFALFQLHPAIRAWAEEVVVEVRKVVWPSRKDTTAMTIVVIIMVLISSVIISSFDLLSGYVVNSLMK